MCGIAGIVSPDPAVRGLIPEMVARLIHRGPDEQGMAELPGATLGSTRLSIQDPSNGHQPMTTEDGSVTVVFNGEIYNYPALRQRLESDRVRFRTRCDTEVLLHLYQKFGADFVQHLDGMFAVGLWDAARNRLILARDHLGQKPLFFCQTNGAFLFASELKAILATGLPERRVDLEALYHYISLRFIPDRMTLFGGISKVPAAHCLVYEGGQARLERYWELSCQNKLSGSEREITDELDRRLAGSVREHLLSDVPVGSFLSGGIDTSLVTALMAQQAEEPPQTFSIGVLEEDFNELPFARIVARRYGTRHHEEVAQPDLIELLPSMVWHLEEPADPFGVGVYLASRLASKHVKVVLSGDGGDELFGGYDRYYGNHLASIYRLIPGALRESVLRRIVEAIPESFAYKSMAQKLRWIQAMARLEDGERYAESMSFLRFTEGSKARLFTESARSQLDGVSSTEKILVHFEAHDLDDLVDRMLYTDLMTRMPDHILPIVDRMSMAHGVEVRAPFLEHKIVEFGMRIPGRLKVRRGSLKHILRSVATRHLDREIVQRPKVGFGFPIAHWMRGELRPLMERVIAESRFVEAGFFNRSYMSKLLSEHVEGRMDHNYRLWLLLNLEVWQRLHIDGAETDEVLSWLVEGRNGSRVLAEATIG
jgi:asparagine synthase (glutamine-hydrolysing)